MVTGMLNGPLTDARVWLAAWLMKCREGGASGTCEHHADACLDQFKDRFPDAITGNETRKVRGVVR